MSRSAGPSRPDARFAPRAGSWTCIDGRAGRAAACSTPRAARCWRRPRGRSSPCPRRSSPGSRPATGCAGSTRAPTTGRGIAVSPAVGRGDDDRLPGRPGPRRTTADRHDRGTRKARATGSARPSPTTCPIRPRSPRPSPRRSASSPTLIPRRPGVRRARDRADARRANAAPGGRASCVREGVPARLAGAAPCGGRSAASRAGARGALVRDHDAPACRRARARASVAAPPTGRCGRRRLDHGRHARASVRQGHPRRGRTAGRSSSS